jgi:nucleotide-binding universal stress UspA family protein
MTSVHQTGPVVTVGVDGSAESIRALQWAARYAAATGGRIRAVLAWHYPAPIGPAPIGIAPAQVTGEVSQHLAEFLSRTVAANAAGVDAEEIVCTGHPAQVLLDQAESADLLVVGARGHAAVTGMYLGSVSVHCVTHAACPVVVVRTRETG